MRSTLCALMIVVLVGLATTAGAYDFLYTGDKAATHDAGGFGLQAGLWYFMADKAYDHDGESQDLGFDWTAMYIPLCVYYAVADQFEVGVKPHYSMLKAEESSSRDASFEGSGLGDTWVYAKYMFMPEPMMTARLGVKVATGDDLSDSGSENDIGTGSGQMDLDGAVLFGIPAGPGMFDGSVGYRMRMENSEYKWKPGNEIHFTGCYSYFMSDMMSLKLAADGYFGSDGADDGETVTDSGCNIVYVNPGIEYMMESGMTLGADFHYPLMGTSNYAEWGVGVYVGFGK